MRKINRDQVLAFLEATNNINIEILARGNALEGPVTPSIAVKRQSNPNRDRPEQVEIVPSYGGRMNYGQQKSFDSALNAAKGGDFVLACELLVASYFYQVEVRPLKSIYITGTWGIQSNPLADTLEPLIWRIEGEEITGHGGARLGAGRPSELGESRLVTFDMPITMRDDLDIKAKGRGISRAELMREMIAKGLNEE